MAAELGRREEPLTRRLGFRSLQVTKRRKMLQTVQLELQSKPRAGLSG